MNDPDKTKEQLVKELNALRRQVGPNWGPATAEPAPPPAALGDSEAEYRLLVKNLPNVIFKGYTDWSVDFIDDKIGSLTGYPKDDFQSRKIKWLDIVVQEDLADIQKKMVQALRGDKTYIREYRIRHKNGNILWIQETGQIIVTHKVKLILFMELSSISVNGNGPKTRYGNPNAG